MSHESCHVSHITRHAHTHTHTYPQTHTHTHTHAHTHMHTHTHARTHTHTHVGASARTNTRAHARTYPCTQALCACKHSHTRTHMLTHIPTLKHTHFCKGQQRTFLPTLTFCFLKSCGPRLAFLPLLLAFLIPCRSGMVSRRRFWSVRLLNWPRAGFTK